MCPNFGTAFNPAVAAAAITVAVAVASATTIAATEAAVSLSTLPPSTLPPRPLSPPLPLLLPPPLLLRPSSPLSPHHPRHGLVSVQVKNRVLLFCRKEKWTKNELSFFFRQYARPNHHLNHFARDSSSIKLCETHLLLLLY